ncbi:hypothetical protein AMTR_s00054p00091550 [Amborella trichopoda]|uniref:Phytochrome chromophore attachment site domain-containing protein n=1 Tax=Amborella trichopoda TaxID=13333 RepID=U5D9P3_AMBTC|nr:hypothetical protein AMTR_s00054p00091550 [Amborella trichopoda]
MIAIEELIFRVIAYNENAIEMLDLMPQSVPIMDWIEILKKLAVRAISRLQSLPGGDIGLLCNTVVEHVREFAGYDRVIVYKFHEDEHGEVVAEIRRFDLEPYLGVHYLATDIPQASRMRRECMLL